MCLVMRWPSLVKQPSVSSSQAARQQGQTSVVSKSPSGIPEQIANRAPAVRHVPHTKIASREAIAGVQGFKRAGGLSPGLPDPS